MTVTQLAKALELPSSTTHRILAVLRGHGYVTQAEEGGTYAPGYALLRATSLYLPASTCHQQIESSLRQLVCDSGESAFFGAYLAEIGRLRFIATIQSHHAIQYVLRSDKTYSVLLGASGLAVAAALPRPNIQMIYERERTTDEGAIKPPEWPRLDETLRQIKSQGFAASDGQRAEGAHAVAAPVLGPEGMVFGCVGISMPSTRKDEQRTSKHIELVKRASVELSNSTDLFTPAAFRLNG